MRIYSINYNYYYIYTDPCELVSSSPALSISFFQLFFQACTASSPSTLRTLLYERTWRCLFAIALSGLSWKRAENILSGDALLATLFLLCVERVSLSLLLHAERIGDVGVAGGGGCDPSLFVGETNGEASTSQLGPPPALG